MENFTILSNWLNEVLEKNIPTGIKAFNFNLYEGSEDTYDIELIGSDEFDEEDPDWRVLTFLQQVKIFVLLKEQVKFKIGKKDKVTLHY